MIIHEKRFTDGTGKPFLCPETDMALFSFYFVTDQENSHGRFIQSPDLEQTQIVPELRKLAGMRALTPAGRAGDMLFYMLKRNGYSICGQTFFDRVRAYGSIREIPCSAQYIAPVNELEAAAPEISRLIVFVDFQRPKSASPEPMPTWPVKESGFYYHNSPAVLAPLVDALAHVALSRGNETLLIALPREKKDGHAFARYTMAELTALLPTGLRSGVRFFSGLPVEEGVNDPEAGFDNAVRFGANAVFCPYEYYDQIRKTRNCLGVDMNAPGAVPGTFGDYISHVPDISDGLAAVESNLSGTVTYDALNTAARQAAAGNYPTMEKIRSQLEENNRKRNQLQQQYEQEKKTLRRQIEQDQQEIASLQRECNQLRMENNQMLGTIRELRGDNDQLKEKNEVLQRSNDMKNARQNAAKPAPQTGQTQNKSSGGCLKVFLWFFVIMLIIYLIQNR